MATDDKPGAFLTDLRSPSECYFVLQAFYNNLSWKWRLVYFKIDPWNGHSSVNKSAMSLHFYGILYRICSNWSTLHFWKYTPVNYGCATIMDEL